MSNNWSQLTTSNDARILIHTLPLGYIPAPTQWALHLGSLLSYPSLTCSVPGGCSVLACAPPSAQGDETRTVLTPETHSYIP
jgi:hypothetical protein